MTEDEVNFEKMKRGILIKVASELFEAQVKEYLASEKWKTKEELDAWLSEQLQGYLDFEDGVKEYYNSKINS